MRKLMVVVAMAVVTLLAALPASAQGLEDPIPETIKPGGVRRHRQ